MITALIPARRPIAWGYSRVSDQKQFKKEDSIEQQNERIEGYYRLYLGEQGIDFAGIECDPHAVSASKRPFELRQAGMRLIEALQPGDHLVIDKMDRLWRTQKDFANLLDWFDKHEINLHIVNMHGMSIDARSTMGRFFMGLMAAVAELESHQLGDRVKAANAALRKAGRNINGSPPAGTRKVRKRMPDGKVRKYIEWDQSSRAIMQEIVRLREEEGLSFEQISKRIEEHLALMNGRPFSTSAFYHRYWTSHRCKRVYCYEKWYTEHNIIDVCDIPTNMGTLALKYWTTHGGRSCGLPAR